MFASRRLAIINLILLDIVWVELLCILRATEYVDGSLQLLDIYHHHGWVFCGNDNTLVHVEKAEAPEL